MPCIAISAFPLSTLNTTGPLATLREKRRKGEKKRGTRNKTGEENKRNREEEKVEKRTN
jgi:hypothetical protein